MTFLILDTTVVCEAFTMLLDECHGHLLEVRVVEVDGLLTTVLAQVIDLAVMRLTECAARQE